MNKWEIGEISVFVKLGNIEDSSINLIVMSKGITLTTGISGITIKEKINASNIEFWPDVSLKDIDRRSIIFKAATNAFLKAQKISASKIGFSTIGLEVARIPSWEIAEELVRALLMHSKNPSCIQEVIFATSSPTQMSSFQFALSNSHLYEM